MSISILENLYREIGSSLRSYLFHRSGQNHAVADDLLQDVFVQAARRLDRLTEARSPRAWLYVIARNVAVTAFRKTPRESALDRDIVDRRSVDNTAAMAIRESIDGLSAQDREILELRLRENLSYAEIADTLHVPIGTVRSRLHAAVRRLRDSVTASQSEDSRS